jgi:excisionase family DNA binding protein
VSEDFDYDRWYPEVRPVMDSKQLAELLNTSDQIIRLWVREGVIPAHRREGGRKHHFLRHEIFEWLMASRYTPGEDVDGGRATGAP